MVSRGRRALRERFDDGRHPDPHDLPTTHRCDLYLATDGSMIGGEAGLGAMAETAEGEILATWRRKVPARDNNDAELRALHFGLDRLSHLPITPNRVGILLDHDVLATAVASCAHRQTPTPVRPPSRTSSPNHWGGVIARISTIPQVRVAVVSGPENPAHALAHRVAAD